MRNAVLTSLACCAICATSAPRAQNESSAGVSTPAGVPVERLVAAVSHKIGKPFVLDPRVRADVAIEGKAPTELSYAELLDVLDAYGFAAFDDDHFVRVVPENSIRTEAIPTITSHDSRPGPEYVSELIVVKNVSAPQVVPILRPLVRASGHLVAYPESQTLLIVDRFENVRRLEGLIHALDNAGSAHARSTDKAAEQADCH